MGDLLLSNGSQTQCYFQNGKIRETDRQTDRQIDRQQTDRDRETQTHTEILRRELQRILISQLSEQMHRPTL